jgi:GntR family transcriptional regulator
MSVVPLERDSSVPLYIQLKEHIGLQIQSGAYPVGSRVPSERELARQYKVSRLTARQALLALVAEGLVYSRVGKGTYVSSPKIDSQLQALTSFSEEMYQRGMVPSSRVIRAGIELADGLVASRLQTLTSTQIVGLSRLRLVDGEPLALETAYLVERMCPNLLDGHDFSHESLYHVLRHDYGLTLVRADEVIEARLPSAHERLLLELPEHTPVLGMSRLTFTDKGQPIEYVRAAYRGDKYQLRVSLHGTNKPHPY